MEIEHNSRQRFFRKPCGAVTCGTRVRFRISIYGAGIPRSVRLVYKRDGGEDIYADMPYVFSVLGSSIYEKAVIMPETAGLVWYYFEIATDSGVVYYGNNSENLGGKGDISFNPPSHSFQITVYNEEYKTPDWFKEGIAYQIFPDRFYNGNEDGSFLGNRTDIIKRGWGEQPFYKAEQFGGEYKSNDFFGGNLKGIIKKLPYLEDLGITMIYLNPIFRAASNHKYDTGSYEEIDPMFGDEETFRELCTEAKKHGIRIILDGVFNHTGDDSQYFNKYGNYDSVGAFQSKDSPYYSWFRFMDFPNVYESWWGMTTLPQVEERSEALREYLLSGKDAIVKKWIRLGASGWRLDVVDELPDFFVKELRKGVKEVNPEAVIIGEVWEDASNKTAYGERREYFYGDELDSVMNYPLRNALIDFALCRIDAFEFNRRIMSLKENYPAPAFYSLLNIISSHDVERVMTLMGGVPTRHEVDREHQAHFKLDGYTLDVARQRAKLIYGMVMMMPGVPCIFYGDELGMQGYGDPFCRACFPWDNMDDVDPNAEMRTWIKKLAALRKSSKALSTGEFNYIYRIGYTYAFIRQYENDKFVVLVNCDRTAKDIRLDAARYGITKLETLTGTDNIDSQYESADGIFYMKAQPCSMTIFKA
ncbi:MAG: glycoside hydrolase family 13 protein [Oscillospiraceae bacterium]|nr:glycoside hydrolase family 13 protein [Oscillospiraceae bacterium]